MEIPEPHDIIDCGELDFPSRAILANDYSKNADHLSDSHPMGRDRSIFVERGGDHAPAIYRSRVTKPTRNRILKNR